MKFRGYTYALRPSQEQVAHFEQFAGVCRLVWNLALDQRKNHWRQYQRATGDNLNGVSQQRQLTQLRAEFDFIAAVSVTSEQRTLKNLEAAFKRFFKGIGGYPQFKRKGAGDSFSFAGREVRIEKLNAKWSRINLPKIGWVKFRDTRAIPDGAKINEATITRTALGWQVSIGCQFEGATHDSGTVAGIDRGVAVPLMLSDGTAYHLPEQVDRLEKRIKRAQRVAARRKRGSKRYTKAQRRVATLKARQARVRKHWAHETTTEIARNHGTIVVERLRTKDMTKSAKGTAAKPGKNVAQKRGLNRGILKVGWHQIETMLAYKAAWFEKVDPAYTSQTCSACGCINKQSRKSQAIFECVECGHEENADLNAAKNIKNRGNTAVLDVEACGCAACEASTRRGHTPPRKSPSFRAGKMLTARRTCASRDGCGRCATTPSPAPSAQTEGRPRALGLRRRAKTGRGLVKPSKR